MTKTEASTAQERATRRTKEYSGVMWHLATFVIINAFFWFLDLRQAGADWAYWITICWGIAVAFHVAWYLIDVSGRGGRKYQKFLSQERAKDASDQA